MSKLLEIETCYECPHFWEYEHYLGDGKIDAGKKCLGADRKLPDTLIRQAPDWCPLEDNDDCTR